MVGGKVYHSVTTKPFRDHMYNALPPAKLAFVATHIAHL